MSPLIRLGGGCDGCSAGLQTVETVEAYRRWQTIKAAISVGGTREQWRVLRHSRQVIFQMAEVAVSRELFRAILERIGWLRLPTPLPG